MKSVGTRFLLFLGGVAVVFSLFIVYRTYEASQRHANELVCRQANLALEFNLAIRHYASQKIRPVMEKFLGKDGFLPETMSTSLISRSIFDEVRKKFPDYIIRLTSNDPRNPANKANPDELRMIEYFRNNPKVTRTTEKIQMDGRPYLAAFTPKWVEESCLHCHGDPKDAPANLVKQYGATASFHQKVGDVAGLDTVAVPVETVEAALGSDLRRQSFALTAGLALLFGSIVVLFRFVVIRRLGIMANHFHAIAANPESPQMTPVQISGWDEIGMVGGAFNTLLDHLRSAHESLEQRVAERTTELAQANEDLKREIAERRRAEAALRMSEEKHRAFVETATDVIWEMDKDGLFTYMSPRVEELTGYSPAEMIGRSPFSFMPGEEAQVMLKQFTEFMRFPRPIMGLQNPMRTKDGRTMFMELNCVPVFDDQGALAGFRGINRDITERKRAEDLIRAQRDLGMALNTASTLEEGLRLCADAAMRVSGTDCGGIYLFDEDTRGLDLAFYQGTSSAFVQKVSHFAPDSAEAQMVKAGKPVYKEEEAADGPISQAKRQEGLRAVAIVPIHREDRAIGCLSLASHQVEEIPGYARDAVEVMAPQIGNAIVRLKAEAALRESEEKHRAFVETATDVIWEMNNEGVFTYVSPRSEEVSGYAPNEMIGKTAFDFMPAGESEFRRERFAEIAKFPRPLMGVVNQFLAKDGRLIWMELNGIPFFDDQGGLAGFRGNNRDITERKRADEERLRFETQVQQAQKLESLGVLAGGIAHDFNNMLTAVIGNAELALADLSPVSPARPRIDEIQKTARGAADLCRQMLAYSGKGKFVVRPVNLSEVVREMGHMLDVSVSKKAILRYNLAQDLPAIEADATQIRQVVMNLIINASEAIGNRSGVISATTGFMWCDRNYLQGLRLSDGLAEGYYAFIEVQDTGSGMDADTLDRVFDPFFTTKFTGRGLGLAAVHGIVRSHKGALAVNSRPGKGTTFRVLFPALDAPADTSQDQIEPEIAHGPWNGGGTILLVDDEDTVRAIGKLMLERIGFQVLVASDGREALKVYRENLDQIGCVLLDLTMPHMDGEETFRELQRMKPDVRVVMTSGYDEQEVVSRFAGKGLGGFIHKPYSIADLRAAMASVLRGMGAHD